MGIQSFGLTLRPVLGPVKYIRGIEYEIFFTVGVVESSRSGF